MSELLEKIGALVGAQGLVADEAGMAPHLTDWRGQYTGRALAVVRPATTREVAEVVRLCAAHRTGIVPQGGNTGLAGGATPDLSGSQVVLSLARLRRVRAVDPVNNTLTAESGCTLAAVQEAAASAGRLFPLSLAAEGTCTIGGNLSTNAGGTAVLRYGNTRELVLGVEVVLADGEVWDGLRGLRKDNSGYDLRQIFIGSEGTLGIVTAAVLKLFPAPRGRATALAGVNSLPSALSLLEAMQSRFGARLVGFELISALSLELVLRHFPEQATHRPPESPWHVLVEISDEEPGPAARVRLEDGLAEALSVGMIGDAVVAGSEAQAAGLWTLRESISDAQAREGRNVKHDVSVPVSTIPRFVEETGTTLERAYPGVRIVCFGHLGDGNLHYNVSAPGGADAAAFLVHREAINLIVHDSVARHGGSITAEHGVGQLRRGELPRYKSAVEMALMRKLKAALDPLGILNPGKVL